jgi:hypothetical protein
MRKTTKGANTEVVGGLAFQIEKRIRCEHTADRILGVSQEGCTL